MSSMFSAGFPDVPMVDVNDVDIEDNMFCDQISVWRTKASLGQYFGWASQGLSLGFRLFRG